MKLGTRGSDLALWQARLVRALLLEKAGVEAELVIIKTQGDKDQVATFDKMEGKGFFTKEIEAALLDRTVDLAVHSLKDLQTEMPAGLTLGAVLHRADRRDMALIRPEACDPDRILGLRDGARVGTSSARRVAQLHHLRPDLDVVALRGNVPTRVRRLREGLFDAILIASAGLDRLELSLDGLVPLRLPEALFVPAPAQGVLGIQIRENDPDIAAAVTTLNDSGLQDVVWLEREILRRLEGGCQLPLGTCADRTDAGLRLRVFLAPGGGGLPRRVVVSGPDKETLATAALDYLTAARRDPTTRRTVWITREPERSRDFAAACDPTRFAVVSLPVFCAVEDGDPAQQKRVIESLGDFRWIFFTSQTTVTLFAELLEKHKAALDPSVCLAAIGRKTARAIEARGWRVEFVSPVADGNALAESFHEHRKTRVNDDPDKPLGRVLFPCGAKASRDLEAVLAADGIDAERMVCYDTVEHPRLAETIAPLPDPDIVVCTSPSAAEFLLARRPINPSTTVVAIGPATTRTLLAKGFSPVWETVDRSLTGLAEVTNGLVTD